MQDIRVIKTKRNIINAFKTLASTKELRKITIKEICDLAECGRSTFYMYYPYKDALYNEIIRVTVDDILSGFTPLPQYRLGNESEHAEEYLHNVLYSLSKIKEITSFIPPKSEAYNNFVRTLTNSMIKYLMETASHIYNNLSESQWVRLNAIIRLYFVGIINESVYYFISTNYSLEFIESLIFPVYKSFIHDSNQVTNGNP